MCFWEEEEEEEEKDAAMAAIEERTTVIQNQLMERKIYTNRVVVASRGDGGKFGGVQMVPISGITGEGLDELMEELALQSEVMNSRADVEARAEGLVIDAKVCGVCSC